MDIRTTKVNLSGIIKDTLIDMIQNVFMVKEIDPESIIIEK